jgi:type I restriction enzyme S subunit
MPPEQDQRQIVAAIEEQFSRLAAGSSSLQRAQRNLERARIAVLDAAVSGKFPGITKDSWEEFALGDLLDDIHAGKSFKCEERPSDLHEWGVVKVSAMTWGRFREGENKTVVDDRRADPRFEIHSGDLLVSRANTVEYVGAAVLVNKCRPRLLLSDKSLRLMPNSKVLPEWLLISLRTSLARRYIESVATGTSDSMRNISQPNLKALRIALPPIDVQSQLVTEVDRMMSQIEQLDESLGRNRRSARVLRSSILSAAFSGELA